MLAPYRVLDLTDEHGLLCGQILADLGADVIAIEPPGGSPARRIGPFAGDVPEAGRSLYWFAYARNKRSVTLDLESEEGRAGLRTLVRDADFLVESFAPGYLDGLGIGYPALRQLNPRLVMVSITAFGQEGPKSHYAATDLIALAASGVLLLTGDEDRPPVRTAVPQAFLHAGAEAAVGALIAHHARERDGIGQHVDVSAQTAAMMATQSFILAEGWGDRAVQRIAGGMKAGRHKLRFVYSCEDGHVSVTFLFGNSIGPYTRRLFEWMYEEEFVDEATRDKDWIGFWERIASREEPAEELTRCTEAIARFMLSKTKAELFAEARRRGLLIVPISTTADLVASEQYRSRGFWTELEHPELGRTIAYPGPFARFTSAPIQYRRRPPLVGEHNGEVLVAEGQRALVASAANVQVAARRGRANGRTLAATASRPGGPRPFPGPGTWDAGFGPPLAGVKVLDLMWVFAGPMGTRVLSDYGATVLHVESALRPDTLRSGGPFKDKRPGADRSGGFLNVNAGKYGLSVNLGVPEGRQLMLRLAGWADVVTESFSPRAMRRWGLDYEALRKVNPDLIMISTCLNGQTGPEADLAGFGTMGAALSGFHELTGWPDRSPAGPFMAYTDYTTPKYVAASILAALDHRRRTGEGQYIDLSQAEASMHFLAPALLDYTVNGRLRSRAGNASPEHAPHGVYPCRGKDRWVAIACGTDEQWQALCSASGHDRWTSDPRFASFALRQQHQGALDAVLAAWTVEHEVREVVLRLQAAGVPAHRVCDSGDALRDPQLRFRRHFVAVTDAELGTVPVESSRLRFSHSDAVVDRLGPRIGEHTDLVLREFLGLNDEAILHLALSGALE
ncbi:MAG TPA: CoA transferase [Dehalococcoidia bacterium]|nr:CoA transferase [Dehalococcoidia bacterium]